MTATPCCPASHSSKRVVLTGGPGAGKTSVLELIKKSFCAHVQVLPEAAGILFGGGFPRRGDDASSRCAQRAIFHVQRELETLVLGSADAAVVLCDRGTLDGLAYWPGRDDEYFGELGTTIDEEFSRYEAVIHLRTPASGGGYDHRNPLRNEDAAQAARIDERIAAIWGRHRRCVQVRNSAAFLDKARSVLALVRAELPECCRHHHVETIDP